MISILNFPVIFSILAFLVLRLAAQAGASLRLRRPLADVQREDFGVIQSAALTLLALLIGFSFSMAVNRYDLRKNYEEAEANAIGTEYLRAGLMSAADATKVRTQLKRYTDLRIAFYQTRFESEVQRINTETAQIQSEMWSVVQAAAAQPTPVVALAVAGMNDVLNSQGYTQAAWWNRIPITAWFLLMATAISCNVLVGYGGRGSKSASLLWVLPLVVSTSFLLIADIDSPRGGLIRVTPQNLVSLAQSLPN